METLGVVIAPDGNSNDQIEAFTKKVLKWTGALRVHSLPKDELFASVSSTIMKTLEYPAGSTTLTESECNKLVKPMFDLVLPRCGICRQLPLALKYGPRDAMGLGFKNLFLTQGVSKIVMFLEEREANSLSKPLINATFEAALMNVGVGGNIYLV